MKKIRKVVIVGAGAMGAFFASKFFDTEDISVSFAADQERCQRLQNEGLIVNQKFYQISGIVPGQSSEPADLIIVCLKHHHLPVAIPPIQHLVGDHTCILSVMNGLNSENIISEMLGTRKPLYAISVGIDAVREKNRITYANPGKHIFGEAENATISKRVKLIQEVLDKAGIEYENPKDMIRVLWWKFMINVGMNPSSAVMRAPYGVFQTKPEAFALMESLMREVIDVATGEGIDLSSKDFEDWIEVLHALSPQGKTSMLQDVEAGFKTEIEIFSQKVVELGEKHGISTPVNKAVMQIVKSLEYSYLQRQ